MMKKILQPADTSRSARLPGVRIEGSTLPVLVEPAIATRRLARIRILLVTLLVAALPSGVFAGPMSVAILPATPGVGDSIDIETTLLWSTAGFSVMSATTTFTSAFELEINISVHSPAEGTVVATVITDELHLTHLGVLPAGEYSYTVFEFDFPGGSDPSVPAGSLSGTFTVVPEPSSFALALFGLSGLAIGRRGKKTA